MRKELLKEDFHRSSLDQGSAKTFCSIVHYYNLCSLIREVKKEKSSLQIFALDSILVVSSVWNCSFEPKQEERERERDREQVLLWNHQISILISPKPEKQRRKKRPKSILIVIEIYWLFYAELRNIYQT